MVNFENKLSYDVYDLKKIISLLRGPGGCPWDFEQTHESISRNLLEEAYEAAEAIDCNDIGHLREELGDVLMQVVFHSDIEESSGGFSLDDVANEACRKLIRRHPHVFGDVSVENSGEVRVNWDNIKKEENRHTKTSDVMRSVARSLPSLWRAEKIQEKAAKAGFDWPDWEGAMEAISGEQRELNEAIESGAHVKIEEELGDLLFSAVNLARFFSVDPENALSRASDKFVSRFTRLENAAVDGGRNIEDMSLEDMEGLYRKIKLEE